MKKIIMCLSLSAIVLVSTVAAAAHLAVEIKSTANDAILGVVNFEDTPYGLLILPNLKSLPPGPHGFHVHLDPTCGDRGMAAQGHLDPENTGKHLGPYNSAGHEGDMPLLYVDNSGKTTTPMLAPKLTVADIKNHAIMIHQGGDNYSDTPEKLGGGGARIACGVAK